MGEGMSRRLRTDAERSADAWRAAADSRPGFVTYEGTPAGDPSWWRHDPYLRLSPVARVMAYPDGPPPVDGETCKQWCGYCNIPAEPEPTQACQVSEEQLRAEIEDSPAEGRPVVLHSGITVSNRRPPPRRRWWHRYTRRNP